MDEFQCVVSGSIEQVASGAFVACVFAMRTWERFTVQNARMTSSPCATRAEAETVLKHLLDDFKDVFAH